jgi:hypothetical protein
MLGYVYLANRSGNIDDWTAEVSKVELLIGGQVIDTQDGAFINTLAPVAMNQSFSKSTWSCGVGGDKFYPLRFSFCENAQSALPLVALQYHDVELRITWGTLESTKEDLEVYAQFIHLDTDERTNLSSTPQNMIVTQTQKAIASKGKIQELNFNHPMKYLIATKSTNFHATGSNLTKLKLQINGTDVTDAQNYEPHFSTAPIYYHTQSSTVDAGTLLVPFCLDTTKIQPTGSLNFSRLDSARLVSDNLPFTEDLYGINYNILRIENGMGGLMYSN